MRYQDLYQFFLIFFAFLVFLGVGIFVYYELFPEYKEYQSIYEDLESFRAGYTGEKPAPFHKGIKQILVPNETGGPEIIDRCTSCHVAIDLPHFSPTRVALDVNDQIILDQEGSPVLEQNPDYVWGRLKEEIESLRHPDLIQHLRSEGRNREADARLEKAEALARLQTIRIEGKKVDVERALQMHPLIGNEIRPFQHHPMEEYGCTSCHSGNGQALVAKRAHGPLLDGEYEPAHMGAKPQFTEVDPENDPRFSKMYNAKPGHGLVFQTTPLLADDLIIAKCVQCHQDSGGEARQAVEQLKLYAQPKVQEKEALKKGIERDESALVSLLTLYQFASREGREKTLDWLNERLQDPTLTAAQLDAFEGQYTFVKENEELPAAIETRVLELMGSEEQTEELLRKAGEVGDVGLLLNESQPLAIQKKKERLAETEASLSRMEAAMGPVKLMTDSLKTSQTTVDRLIAPYSKGKELFISQACYSCHKIAGFARGGVGPELTKAGNSYPWFIKESIVWPQADLPSSTMPNFRLDHEELSALMTFLMAQKGETKAVSEVEYQIKLHEWEKGAKMPWEKPVPPPSIKDVQAGQLVFASEGCAACHKLQGFESNVEFISRDGKLKVWFEKLFPEQISGNQLADRVEQYGSVIDQNLVKKKGSDGSLEPIEKAFPGLIEGFYTNFKFAMRARNHHYQNDPESLALYQKRLGLVFMMYVETYGLGRDIAPHLNWSGVYRDSGWLLGHFQNPAAYTARSIMPTMPFDDSKFYMLNHMLHHLGARNRDHLHASWKQEGFQPAKAYEVLCSSCHGENRQGNGLVSEWIYPIPKNLRNPIFLRALTKERAVDAIKHGVRGTPMPPWGESALPDQAPVLNDEQIRQMVDWLYQGVPYDPRMENSEEAQKWEYSPEEVVKEMEKERELLPPAPSKNESKNELVEAYFEARPNQGEGPDQELYYIREKYYTPENLSAGKEYYNIHCATCHGKEGTGAGLRSTTMIEAKPRMFTNLPWIRSRDDLRLLRSIKFGVPGTAMTPWGDQTSSAQRMQLVMYIREFTRLTLQRDDLEQILYDTLDRSSITIEEARIGEYTRLQAVERTMKEKQERLYELTEKDQGSPEAVGALYAELVSLKKEKEKRLQVDELYLALSDSIKRERTLYETVGSQLIAAKLPETTVHVFFNFVRFSPLSYTLKEGQLLVEKQKENEMFYVEQIVSYLEEQIGRLQKEIGHEESKVSSPERGRRIQELMAEQGIYINLKTKLQLSVSEATELRLQQLGIAEKIGEYGKNSV